MACTVTPGLIDMHFHAYNGTGERGSYAGDLGILPDGFTFRSGVTTVVDAGSSGWRNFEDFKDRVIDRSKTRVLAMLNIVGAGMRGSHYEQNNRSTWTARPPPGWRCAIPGLVVGIKTAHFRRSGMDAGGAGGDRRHHRQYSGDGGFRRRPAERPLYDLLTKKLRPGDVYTHMYSGLRQEQDPVTLGPSKGFIEGRARGIYFDTGTGGGSFKWSLAVPMIKQGFKPDSISTDLHVDSMNSATKNILNVASKLMAIGLRCRKWWPT